MWKNVHPVSGAGIQTHNLLIMSLLLQPLDQGSRPLKLYLLKELGSNFDAFLRLFVKLHFYIFTSNKLKLLSSKLSLHRKSVANLLNDLQLQLTTLSWIVLNTIPGH